MIPQCCCSSMVQPNSLTSRRRVSNALRLHPTSVSSREWRTEGTPTTDCEMNLIAFDETSTALRSRLIERKCEVMVEHLMHFVDIHVNNFKSDFKRHHLMIGRLRSVQHTASPLDEFCVQLQLFSRGSAMFASRYLSS